MKIHVFGKCKTQIIDRATGRVVKDNDWIENLIFDQGLNALAGNGSGTLVAPPAGIFGACVIGGGTNPNAVASGAVTFTQDNGGGLAGNILTASAPIFTLAMVGQLFKWGVGAGGVETYITGFTSNQIVTVDTSALIVVPAVGTIWNVSQTALQTPLYVNDGYQTLAGNCGTTLSGNQATHQRYFVFNAKDAPYGVNEIGYGRTSIAAGSKIAGRFVLSSSDVIAPTQFYVVIMQVVVTYGPSAPSAVGNVGTNIDTTGMAMVETLDDNAVSQVTNTGSTTNLAALEAGGMPGLFFSTATYTQNGTPDLSPGSGVDWSAGYIDFGPAEWIFAAPGGKMSLTFNAAVNATGQMIYGIGIGPISQQIQLDVNFTTPQTAPTGIFQPNTVWTATYDRILSN